MKDLSSRRKRSADDLISDILHSLDSDERRDVTLRRTQDRFADGCDSWLVYDDHRPGEHHGPTGPWPEWPACMGDS